VDVKALEQVILEHQDKLGKTNDNRPYRAMFYTIPVFNNPTTITFPPG
jgi:DNA-binding transcriptional MocR family regulator